MIAATGLPTTLQILGAILVAGGFWLWDYLYQREDDDTLEALRDLPPAQFFDQDSAA